MTSAVPYAEVIGSPVGHSKSPAIHRFWLDRLGLDGDYRATEVGKDDLERYLRERRGDPLWRGCNVTMPLKESALALADEQSADAGLVRATNCLVPGPDGVIVAHNTDVDGVREALRHGGEQQLPSRDHVATLFALIGTGGAARSALAVLKGADVTVYGRDVDKARALSAEFGAGGDGYHDHLDALGREPIVHDPADKKCIDHFVINATSLGMRGHPPLPIRLDSWPRSTVVIDMVYDPLETELLAKAREQGMIAVDGLVMLVGQAARAFELFFGVAAPRQHDRELRELLTQ